MIAPFHRERLISGDANMPSGNHLSSLRAVILFLCVAFLPVACGKEPIAPVPPPNMGGTVTGTVTSSVTGRPVSGAEVRIGATVLTTGATGQFRFIGLAAGAVTLRCKAASFEDFEKVVEVGSAGVTQDVGLTRIEVFEFGDFALYVPATVESPRGVIIALGGPDTRGFATRKPMGAPVPAVEASLQSLGEDLRTLASIHGLAILGTSRAAMSNGIDSDRLLFDAVDVAGTMSGRQLSGVPVLMYGMSGGGPQASGFTARNGGWVIGLFMKAPMAVSSVSDYTLSVPTYMVLEELDTFVDNAALTAAFEFNRSAGALWALAKEPGVPHHSLTPVQRHATINWMNAILDLRLPPEQLEFWGFSDIAESSGWLGNRATGEAAPWASYLGDRTVASWLPSESTAREWGTLVGAKGIMASSQMAPIR
jgi:hypothetical protein